MQHEQGGPDPSSTRPRLARTRFVEMQPEQHATGPLSITGQLNNEQAKQSTGQLSNGAPSWAGLAAQASLPERSIAHLTQLSGMLRPLRSTQALEPLERDDDGYWPLGIQQIGPLPIVHLYGHEPCGRTLPSAVSLVTPTDNAPTAHAATRALTTPTGRLVLGLLVGVGLLVLAALFVNLPATLALLSTHLLTPAGIGLGLLAGMAYLAGHTIRGLRWKLLLDPLGQVRPLVMIRLAQLAAWLNFVLPVRTGEAAKCLALKRLTKIPINKALPTVASDKVLDLVVALLILALVPWLGVPMAGPMWLILGIVGVIWLCCLLFVGLMAWKRAYALKVLQTALILCPKVIENKIEGFVTGFGDALLAGVCHPLRFLPALVLAGVAALCDGLFVLLAFGAVGAPITFGVALFGYTLGLLFSILPQPPGQLGSYEVVGLLIFSGLLALPTSAVAAMYIFTHLWIALLLSVVGLTSLKTMGLTVKSALHIA